MERSDPPSTVSTTPDPEAKKESFFGVIIHSFFIIPFLIAVFCVLLFAAVRLLTSENQTVYDLLEDVKTGGVTKRWQAAFELSKILANGPLTPQDQRFTDELISAFRHSEHDDDRVRQYLALAMGRSGKSEFFSVLTEKLSKEKEENLYAIIYALGMLRDPRAVAQLKPFAEHPQARLRSVTVASLGQIGDPGAKEILKKTLSDPEPNVEWGSAISLAQMGDQSGKHILAQLLNRKYLAKFPQVDTQEQTHLVLAAIDAAAKLNDPQLNQQIAQLAVQDANMKVRAAAMSFGKNISE